MSFNTSQFNGATFNASQAGATALVLTEVGFQLVYARDAVDTSRTRLSMRFQQCPTLNMAHSVEARLTIKADFEVLPRLNVNTGFSLLWGAQVNAGFEVSSPMLAPVEAPFAIDYDYTGDVVNASFSMPYEVRVGQAMEISYSYLQKVNAPIVVPVGLVTTVNAPFDMLSNVLNVNPVSGPDGGGGAVPGFSMVYNLEENLSLDVTNAIVMEHGGDVIEIQQGTVLQDEGGFNWQGRIELADVADYGRFRFNDDVTLTIYGEPYNMMVQSKSLNRQDHRTARAELELLGVAARLDTPIAEPINQTYGAIGAHDAVEAILGTTVSWQVPDWVIPSGRLVGEDVSPVELATKIVEAVGGRLEAQPDGTLVARFWYPTKVANYLTATPDHTYTEADSILSVSEGIRNNKVVNKIRIRDADDSSFTDRIVFEADDDSGLRGDLFVYPSPFRAIHIQHTGPTNVLLTQQNPVDVIQVKEEVVEITDGSGSVGFPIAGIISLEWLENDLMGLNFAVGSTTVQSTRTGDAPKDDHSLVRVTYQTRAKHWRASSPSAIDVQFLVVDGAP